MCVCVIEVRAREVEQPCLECDSAFVGLITVLSVCLLAYICVPSRGGAVIAQSTCDFCATECVAVGALGGDDGR